MSKHLEASLTFFIVFSWALPCDTWLKCHCFKSTPSSSSLLFYSISGLGSLTVSLLYQLSTLWSMILCHFSFHAKRNSSSAMAWMSSILPTFSYELFNKDLEAPGEGSGSSPQHFLWMSVCDSALRLLLPSFFLSRTPDLGAVLLWGRQSPPVQLRGLRVSWLQQHLSLWAGVALHTTSAALPSTESCSFCRFHSFQSW